MNYIWELGRFSLGNLDDYFVFYITITKITKYIILVLFVFFERFRN